MSRKRRRAPTKSSSGALSTADQQALIRAAHAAGRRLARALAPLRQRQGPATAADLNSVGAALVATMREFSASIRSRLGTRSSGAPD